MKHNIKITLILLAMFLITQIIGLLVIQAYSPKTESFYNESTGLWQNKTINPLPSGFQGPELKTTRDFATMAVSIAFAFVIAILLLFLLMKIKTVLFLRLWFFAVVVISIALVFNAVFLKINFLNNAWIISLLLAAPLAIFKIFRRNMIIHNFTELLIYPGIAAVFVPILNIWTIIILLIVISIYDMWAVWHSGVMQKMAKFQMNELKLFAGFFVPYLGKKQREQIKLIREKYKNKKIPEKAGKIKVHLAILGGGDVVFPIITAGVFLRAFSLIPALFIIAGATLSLAFLFFRSEKKKFYPAMPFISAGIFIALIIWKIPALF